MKMRKNLYILILALTIGFVCGKLVFAAQETSQQPSSPRTVPPLPADVKVLKDIEYAKIGGPEFSTPEVVSLVDSFFRKYLFESSAKETQSDVKK